MKGKDKCKILKEIRKEIAKNNDIEYVISECKFSGECKGTCPKCEAEVRYLEQELEKRRALGKKVAVAGITAASIVSLGSMTACNIPFIEKLGFGHEDLTGDVPYIPENDTDDVDVEYPSDDEGNTDVIGEIIEEAYELDGDIAINYIGTTSLDKLISDLENKGYTVECTPVEQQLLSGERYRLVLNNDIDTQIVVYVYDSAESAKKDSLCIDETGFSFTQDDGDESESTIVDWIDIPHFYLCKNTIIQYVGTDEDILSVIESVCGEEFAGGE